MSQFTRGFLWGAAVGGVIGLLHAPRKGRETREIIKDVIDETTDDVNDVRYKVDNLNLAVQRLSNEGLQSLNEAGKDIQSSVKKFKVEAEPRFNRIQEQKDTLKASIETAKADLEPDSE